MTSIDPRPYLLKGRIQNYAWGTRGEDAFIPRLLDIDAGADRPYAELWLGAHVKAPSRVVVDDSVVSLRRLILQNPVEVLGERVFNTFSGTLPFLFKVLSVAEALSIQAHPNKEQAQALNARDPEHYPDDNHKLELAVALDSLTALVGFKRFSEILRALEEYPGLVSFVGEDVYHKLQGAECASRSEQRELVRLMYSTLVERSTARREKLAECLAQLEGRLRGSERALREEERIFLELREKYGADVGLFTIFLLNLVHLEEGEGVFIDAGIPHAYLEGNIIECMTNSDNVVRAGLTPKFKDAETLVEILTYELGPVPTLRASELDGRSIYQTPASEFQVGRWRIRRGDGSKKVHGDGPRILLVLEGELSLAWERDSQKQERVFRRGQAVLLPALLGECEIASTGTAEFFSVGVPL